MGLNPAIWGPHGWFFLESLCLAYPSAPSAAERQHMRQFFSALQHVLPCEGCRAHFQRNLAESPLTDAVLQSRNTLVAWILEMHNKVRRSNNQRPYSIEDFTSYYNAEYNSAVFDPTVPSITLLGFLSGFLIARYV